MTHSLERALSRFRRAPENGSGPVYSRISAAAFRAAVEQRLAALERDLGEIKTRINGLIFVAVGAVLAQLVVRVLA
jgi:hypothetical protein